MFFRGHVKLSSSAWNWTQLGESRTKPVLRVIRILTVAAKEAKDESIQTWKSIGSAGSEAN